MTDSQPAGTESTRRFYDRIGWLKQDGKLVDSHMFGVKEDGPIRVDDKLVMTVVTAN